MRKILALAMVALVALMIGIAVVGCSKKTETTTDQTMPPPEATPDTMMSDTSMMAPDTSMSH